MASVHQLHPAPIDDAVLLRLTRLLRLEVELGIAETRVFARTLVTAIAIALPATIALIAAFVVLLAAALSPIFGAPWQPLLTAGGSIALLALGGLAWSAWRLTHLSWPHETLNSLEENWRWLAAQLKSRLTLRSPAA